VDKKTLKHLDLFSGYGGFTIPAQKYGIETIGFSEIDKYAIQVSNKNYPNIHNVGNVVGLEWNDLSKQFVRDDNGFSSTNLQFDLLIGGSPCQDLSIAKKDRKGLDGERSGLFWEYVRILKEVKPKYFILENVASMPKEARSIITEVLGVEPIMINAALVSAQNRKRLFWTNIPKVTLPEDRGILLKDILEAGEFHGLYSDYNNSTTFDKARTIGTGCGITRSSTCQQVIIKPVRIGKIGKGGQGDRVYSIEGKTTALSALGGGRGAKTGLYAVKDFVRKLTPVECERLQGLPDNYTEGVSNTQRYKCCGNAFNVDVVAHILSFIK